MTLRKALIILLFLCTPAYAVTENYDVGAGDGKVRYANLSWSTCRSNATGTSADYTDATVLTGYIHTTDTPYYTISRMFLPIDTSAIPDNAIISSATLYVYFQDPSANDVDAQAYVTVVQTSQSSGTALTTSDYNDVGSTAGTDAPIAIESLTDLAYNSFALNATGLSWINKTGYTLLGLREGHDFENLAIDSTGVDTYNWFPADPSEGTNGAYLSVTYTVPEAPAEEFTGDGFESGDYSEWTSTTTGGTGSTLAVDTTTVYSGAYSSKSFTTNDDGTSYFDVSVATQNLSDVYIRWYTYITTLALASGSNLFIVGTGDAADGEVLNVQLDDVTEYLELKSDISTTSSYDTEAFPFNEWVCMELRIHIDNTAGDFELWKNGSKIAAINGEDTRNLSDYLGAFALGITLADDITADANVYVDEVLISESPIGCNVDATYHRGPMVIQ